MKSLWLVCSLAMAGEVSPLKVCRYQDILDYLNLTKNNEMFTLTRPVTDWTRPTMVHLDMMLYAILGVNEKAQIFTPYVWVSLRWNNELVSWNPQQFCGISKVAVPKQMLWHPDLAILEHIEGMDKVFLMPYVYISHDGTVEQEDGFRLVSTCKMDVYKFPFDTQRCTITFSSAIYLDRDLHLQPASNSSWLTCGTREYMQNQGEWDFLNISVAQGKMELKGMQWDTLKFTITIKRRPLLIVMHFMLPVLFFLILDISSFLISDTGGEKLGLKVTVLLANSVLLLILNDILPSTSDRTPLIVTYCIVIFAFMLLSILDSILVKYLIEKDSAPQDSFDSGTHCQQEAGRMKCACIPKEDGVVMCELERDREGMAGSQVIVQDQRTLQGSSPRHRAQRVRARPHRWEKMARRINAVFVCLYLIAVCMLLLFLFLEWTN